MNRLVPIRDRDVAAHRLLALFVGYCFGTFSPLYCSESIRHQPICRIESRAVAPDPLPLYEVP
jgi:hypothetical protein